MNNVKEKLSFLLENIFLSTNALAISMLGENNKIVAEIGDVDMDLLSKNLGFLFPVLDNICLSCAKSQDPYLINVIKKNSISIVCVRLTELFSLIAVYSKEVNVNSVLEELEILIKKIVFLLQGLEKGAKNVVY